MNPGQQAAQQAARQAQQAAQQAQQAMLQAQQNVRNFQQMQQIAMKQRRGKQARPDDFADRAGSSRGKLAVLLGALVVLVLVIVGIAIANGAIGPH